MFGKRVSQYLEFQWPLLVLTAAVGLARLGLSLAGTPGVFAAPEFSGPAAQDQWLHALAHLTIGMVVAPLLLWGMASLVLWVTRRSARRANAAGAAGRTSAAG